MDQVSREYSIIDQITMYKLNDEGLNEEEIRARLGSAMHTRDYGVGAQILHALGIRKLRLITNNPVQRVGLNSVGLEMVEEVPIPTDQLDTEHHEERFNILSQE